MLSTTEKTWTDASKKPPVNRRYHMLFLDVGHTKPIRGWWTGQMWDGLHYGGEEVLRWRLVEAHE